MSAVEAFDPGPMTAGMNQQVAAQDHVVGLSWFSIIRLGLVQTALGAIVVLTTSTLNRVMVVELALPAMLPGALVAIHYAVQMSRPRWGYGSDMGGRRTPWIIGGMATLAVGGVLAAMATAFMSVSPTPAIIASILAFIIIGIGVGASGTSLLALLATTVAPQRRAAAASIVWIMMIAGMVVTAITAGQLLDPFSWERLIAVTAGVSVVAFLLATVAVTGVEATAKRKQAEAAAARPVFEQSDEDAEEKPDFRTVIREVWAEAEARRFSIFVFVSMLAYSGQDLILEPFAGHVFGMTPGESTQLAGVQHGGVLVGMIMVAIAGSAIGGRKLGSMRMWAICGCLASAAALGLLAAGAFMAETFPLKPVIFALGLANGAFAVAAIGSMMGLAGKGKKKREGVRMGLWGAAQAIAFGLGGFLGTVAVDVARSLMASPVSAYASVFTGEAILFLVSAILAARIGMTALTQEQQSTMTPTSANPSGVGEPIAGRS